MVVIEVGEFGGVDLRIRAGERGAAEQVADAMCLQIAGDAAPQQRDRRVVAIFGRDAGATELKQLPARRRVRDQRRQVE